MGAPQAGQRKTRALTLGVGIAMPSRKLAMRSDLKSTASPTKSSGGVSE